MSIDIYLKLGDLKGESEVPGHENQIEVLTWNWVLHQEGSIQQGSGGGAGKVSVKDLSLTKYIDTASPTLLQSTCTGKHFDEAKLTMRKATGADPLDYYVITMKHVIVTGVDIGHSAGGVRMTEEISLSFAEFEVSYQPQDDKGKKKGGAISAKFNIAKNKA